MEERNRILVKEVSECQLASQHGDGQYTHRSVYSKALQSTIHVWSVASHVHDAMMKVAEHDSGTPFTLLTTCRNRSVASLPRILGLGLGIAFVIAIVLGFGACNAAKGLP